jgi:hypothetical protein
VKKAILEGLTALQRDLRELKRIVKAEAGPRIGKRQIRQKADELATRWVEELRSPLEHKFKIDSQVIAKYSEGMKHLHVLSRPNNLRSSYLTRLNSLLKDFDNRLILPIKQTALELENALDLSKLVPGLMDPNESEYMREAVDCAGARHYRAAIVMGWCAAVDRMQRKVMSLGFASFNAASQQLKGQTSGKFKKWNKSYSISTLAELQEVFDSDLITVLEGMSLLDGNQADRLRVCFQYRNHSGHPGGAPIEEAHVVAFFRDICAIVLESTSLSLP